LIDSLLNSFIKVGGYINFLTINDIAVAVTDKEKYMAYFPGKTMNHNVKVGDLLKKDSLVVKAMENRENVIDRADSKLFGIPYIGIAIPIYNEDKSEVIGSVFFGESTEKQDLLRDFAIQLSNSSQNVSEATQQIAAQAEELSSMMKELSILSSESNKDVDKIDNVINFIKEISSETELLGFNALIEAARVGSAGSGFAVVVEEIRKLSKRSNNSVENIEKILENIKDKSNRIKEVTELVKDITDKQASISQSIAASSQEIFSMTEELLNMADNLSEKN
jgi:methyl-accepting chemotaxis protein